MSRPLVALRPDAGPGVGAGHVTRCAALAHALRRAGARTLVLLPPDAAPPRFAGPCRRVPGARRPRGVLAADVPDVVPHAWVLDSYTLSAAERAAFAARAPVWVPLDAPARRVPADGVFSALPFPKSTAAHLPARRRLLGPRYAPLRPDLPPATARGGARTVLVSFGAADPTEATLPVARALAAAGWRVRALVGGQVRDRARRVAALARLRPAVEVLDGRRGLVGPLAGTSYAVLSASQSLLEALALGRVVVAVETAANQRATARWAVASGVARSAGRWSPRTPTRIVRTLEALARAPQDRSRLRRRARAVVDGRGAERVARALLAAQGGARA